MKCCDCRFYEQGQDWNRCKIIEAECFRMQNDCTFVLDNGEINKEEVKKAFGGN